MVGVGTRFGIGVGGGRVEAGVSETEGGVKEAEGPGVPARTSVKSWTGCLSNQLREALSQEPRWLRDRHE
jgi:hypothetical protein